MPLFSRPPDINKLVARQDLEGLVKAAEVDDREVRAAAWNSAIRVALEMNDWNQFRPLARAMASRAAAGDDSALDALVDVVSFKHKGPGTPGGYGQLESAVADALQVVGPRAAQRLLPLLDYRDPDAPAEEYQIVRTVVRILGGTRDLSVLEALLRVALRETDNERLGKDFRQSCGVACMNLFDSDREGYVAVAKRFDEAGRRFLAAAASYVGSGIGSSTGGDLEASRLAKEIYERPRPSRVQLTVNLNSRQIRTDESLTGTVLLRTRDERPRVRMVDAPLVVHLDGQVVDRTTTDAKGEAQLAINAPEPGQHALKVTYPGSVPPEGGGYLSESQSQRFEVVTDA